jgi:hypothetical protein
MSGDIAGHRPTLQIGVTYGATMATETTAKKTAKPSALVDTRVIYCGDNHEQRAAQSFCFSESLRFFAGCETKNPRA